MRSAKGKAAAHMRDAEDFTFLVVPPGGTRNAALAISAARSGATGIIDLEYEACAEATRGPVARAAARGPGRLGVKIDGYRFDEWRELLVEFSSDLATVLLTFSSARSLRPQVSFLREHGYEVLIEATNAEEAAAGERAGVDAIVAKGNEAGGRVGEEGSFIFLQHVAAAVSIPFFAHGGVGPHTIAACLAAGARGVVLDWQLALARGASLGEPLQTRLPRMDGREPVCVGQSLGRPYRVVLPPGADTVSGRIAAEEQALRGVRQKGERLRRWHAFMSAQITGEGAQGLLPVGQDVSFAARLARRHRTVKGILDALRESLARQCAEARELGPLAEGTGSAVAVGTRYPIVQGPMSRVSDTPAFADAVAGAGALPVIAAAMMDPEELQSVLAETGRLLGERPWGVGLLGFIDAEFYARQVALVKQARPSIVLIAGGQPAQAAAFEKDGIPAYIHVPTANLLSLFMGNGVRRIVLEGRECGGHIGTFTSFVLWENAVATLLEQVTDESGAEQFDVWFAGGIHDALSAAMVGAIAAPLAGRGLRVGVLMATAYLMTDEAVSSGAITEQYRQCLLEAERTDVLDSGGGYEVRTAPCRFVQTFEQEKARLIGEGKKAEEVRETLEMLNLGRLRIAAKGVVFNLKSLEDPNEPMTHDVPPAKQKADGVFMAGQAISFAKDVSTLAALHASVSGEAVARLRRLAAPELPAPVEIVRTPPPCEVAIIGMSCVFPGAGDLETYWNNILNKVYAITEIPSDRWDWQRYFDPDRNKPDKIYSRWGGFIDPIPFDPTRYRIPPAAVKAIDPLQLMPLEMTRRALEDAGYGDGQFDGRRTSVVFGVAGGMGDFGLMYGVRSSLPLLIEDPPAEMLAQLPEWTEDSFAGILANVVAGRIANCFDLHGPNYTVDAACGSGLAAVFCAVREITQGTSDTAIVGASDVMQNPFGFLCFAQTQALSPTGCPRPFDAKADGIAIGEGVAAVVLKRLDLAERDGDRVYAVIRGVGAASDGHGASMTAPQTNGQLRAFAQAYGQSGVPISGVGLMEAHGTGTTLGDGVEARSMHHAFKEAGAAPGACAVGSVKSMIGHTKGCAGIAGLIKSALALYHKVLPPTFGVDDPAPADCWGAESPIYVNTEARPWIGTGDARRAGIDAFGFGGSNFHTLLEEHDGDAPANAACPLETWPCELFCWSGESAQDLHARLGEFGTRLESAAQPLLRDLAALVTQRGLGRPGTRRLAIVAESVDDLREKTAAAAEALASDPETINDPRGIYYASDPLRSKGRIAFVFPGQGSQRPDMMRDLAVMFPEMRACVAAGDRATAGRLPKRLSELVYPPPRFSPEEDKACMAALTVTNVTQPALGVVSMGLMKILALLGIEPEMTAGHSVAEYIALCAAGVFPETTLYELLEFRGACIVESCRGDTGTMLAVKGGLDDVAPILEEFKDVHAANFNAPTQTILSGREQDLKAVSARLKKAKIKSRPIPVSCGFHSPFVQAARGPLADKLGDVAFTPPALPVYSNARADAYPADRDEIRNILSDHLVQSVRFTDEITKMYEDGARVFVEVGPGSVMTNLVDQILGDRPHVVVACDAKSPRHDLFQLLQAVAQLAAQGVGVDPSVLFRRRRVRPLDPATLDPVDAETPGPLACMLGPDKVWPMSGQRPVMKPLALGQGAATAPLPAAPAPAGPVDATRSEALRRHQQLMSKFLEQQKQVMLAYFGGGAPDLPAAATALHAAPPRPAQDTAPVQGEPAPAPVQAPPAPPPDAAPLSAEALAETLAGIVSERTGYPPDMLNPESDLEGDLGIDSIKRVEVVAAFAAAVPGAPGDLGEKLGGARTLRDIVERAVAACGEQAGPADRPAAAAATAPASEVSSDAIREALLGVVAERTGYPPEMLDLNADMEGDLGIDSIKRVEILGAFAKRMSEAHAGAQLGADELGQFKTLGAVVEHAAVALTGGGGTPSAAQTAPDPAPASISGRATR